jgi:hypothetical protein
MAYDIGQAVRLPVTVRDVTGAVTDATMAITVTRPDGTVYTAPSITHDGLGQYHADVIPDANNYGPWLWTYTASGAAIGVYTGQFLVRTPGPRIVSLVEAKKHLNKDLTITTDDEDIRDFIDAAQFVIEFRLGTAVVPRTVVEYFDGGTEVVHLRTGPVMSILEVREQWSPGDQRVLTAEPDTSVGLSDSNYILENPTRRVLRRMSGYPYQFPPGSLNVKVTYRVGTQVPQANVHLAALELISHVWRASQLASGQTRTKEVTESLVAIGYAVPNRVRELLAVKRAPRLGIG